jgi:hypothetical protein
MYIVSENRAIRGHIQVHMLFCVEAIDKTGGEDYCLLVATLVKVAHGKVTTD